MRNLKIYIPYNDLGIEPGLYGIDDIVEALRLNAHNPEVVYFIADMLEE